MNSRRGRCIEVSKLSVTLLNASGKFQYPLTGDNEIDFFVGDIVEISDSGSVRVLTKSDSGKMTLANRILDSRRLKAAKIRIKIETEIRRFFNEHNFLEVHTPLLVRSPGVEAHIDCLQLTNKTYLPSSPEFAMKKLLIGGLENIFQICSAFRDEPFSQTHRPEFSMLEFYRAFANEEIIQQDFENLVENIALQLFCKPEILYQSKSISLKTPWPRFTVNELFLEHVQVDLRTENTKEKLSIRAEALGIRTDPTDSWDEIYFRIWIEKIEDKLPKNFAFFVTEYPASQAALSTLKTDETGFLWARRFEAYIGGLELCNGFNELTDPHEQTRRFEKELELKRKFSVSAAPSEMPRDFIEALSEGMPPSGGVAVGLDRLVMLFADEVDIDYCYWLNPETTALEKQPLSIF